MTNGPRSRGRSGAAVSIALAVLAVAIVLERLHTRAEPIERDVAGYAVIGHEMRRGRVLYADLWERKPPLLYATFAAAERLTRYGPAEVFAVNVAAALATLLGCHVAGRAGGGAIGGLAAAGWWVALGADLKLGANQPNAEVFVNAALTAAFAVTVHWTGDRARWGRAAVVGVLFAVATLYKHHVVVTCGMIAVGHVWARGCRQGAVAESAVALAVVAAAWAGLFGYFAAVGRLGPMVDVLFRQNAAYAGGPVAATLWFLRPANLAHGFAGWTCGPALLIAAATAAARPRSIPPRWRLWIGWAIGSALATALPTHLFPHYYQYEIPVLCVAAGWASASLLRGASVNRAVMVARCAIVAVAITLTLGRELPFYRLTPDQWSAAKGMGDFAQQHRLARRLAELLRPTETFWDDGQDNTLYLISGRSPPSGLLYPDPLRTGTSAEARAYRDRLTANITAARPDAIVTHPADVANDGFRDPPLDAWVRQHYDPAPGVAPDCPDFAIAVRRGSDLASRLKAGRATARSTPSSPGPEM